NAINQKLACALLQKQGHTVTLANNGKEALEHWQSAPFDAILMDVDMPEMNGYEATREIKTFAPTLPVIALTAYAQSGDKKKALDAGCDDYLTKPVSKELLMDKIKKFQVWVI
ncbi:MAG: response regulator, partial [Bacteroidota bacterium]